MSRVCDLTNNGVLTGNKISHSAIKNKRKFLPNLQNISLRSDALNQNFNLRIATKTLRTINKYGSLDSFLINSGFNNLSEKGKILRRKVMKILMKTGEYENIKIIKKSIMKNGTRTKLTKKEKEQQEKQQLNEDNKINI